MSTRSCYSERSAACGSTTVARCAGRYDATAATTPNTTAAEMNVDGSSGVRYRQHRSRGRAASGTARRLRGRAQGWNGDSRGPSVPRTASGKARTSNLSTFVLRVRASRAFHVPRGAGAQQQDRRRCRVGAIPEKAHEVAPRTGSEDEIFCNHVARATIVPQELLLRSEHVAG